MIEYQVLYWRDIPAQIKVYSGRRPQSHPLPGRFQVAIDRIAMHEGMTGTEAYLDQWQWSDKHTWDGDAQDPVAAITEHLENEGDARLAAYSKPS